MKNWSNVIIPICWNVLIWLKYDFNAYLYASSFLVLWDHCADTGSWIRGQIRIYMYEGKYGYLRANTDICPIFALSANNQHWLLAIIGHAKTNILQQNMW
jgi:hypothetical protein